MFRSKKKSSRQRRNRSFQLERLESRNLMSADFIVPPNSGVIDVTNLPQEILDTVDGLQNAVPNDGVDDTAAIQAALDAYPAGGRIIYLPNGVYNISSTLDWPEGPGLTGQTGATAFKKLTTLQGESTDGAILRLQDGVATTSETRMPVLQTGLAPAQRFGNSVRNLTINTGLNNPFAVGAEYIANNQGTFQDVQILSEDGQGKIGLATGFTAENGPALIKNVRITGFEVGIQAASAENSLTFEHIVLRDQSVVGIETGQQTLTLRGLDYAGPAPAIVQTTFLGSVHLLDSSLVKTGEARVEAAIENHPNSSLFAHNVQTEGFDVAVATVNDAGQITGTVTGPNLELWTSNEPQKIYEDARDGMIDLQTVETPVIPMDQDVSKWANVMDAAYGAIPDDGLDDTAAIQRAIDDPSKTTVYLPAGVGTFTIDSDLILRGNIERLIGFDGRLSGHGSIRVADGTSDKVIIERLRISADRDDNNNVVGSDLNIDVETDRDVIIANSQLSGANVGDVDSFNLSGPGEQLTVQAETFTESDGIGVFRNGTVIGSINDGEWVRYESVDFGSGIDEITARVSSPSDSSSIEFRLGSPYGTKIGSVDIPRTGAFSKFQNVTTDIDLTSGVQDLYLVFHGGYGVRGYGEGRLFVEDIVTNQVRIGDGKELYARQLNAEGQNNQLVNEGGIAWILGQKSEQDQEVIVTTDGGVTEAFGVYVYSGTGPAAPDENPMFEVRDAFFSTSFREHNAGTIDPYVTLLSETRNGEVRTLINSTGAPTREMLLNAFPADFALESLYAEPGSYIEGESFDSTDGAGIYNSRVGQKSGAMRDGEWVGYKGLDLGGVDSKLNLRLASGNRNGATLEVRSGDPAGKLLGTVEIPNTGSWDSFESFVLELEGTNGVTDVYFVARGTGRSLVDIDYFFVETSETRSALQTFESERLSDESGLGVYGGPQRTLKLGDAQAGDWAIYRNIDFATGIDTVDARVSSRSSSGTVEFRLDSPNGPLIASITPGNTGGWDNYVNETAPVSGVTGVHDLYLVFSGQTNLGGLIDVDNFSFSGGNVAPATQSAFKLMEAEDFKSQSGVGIFARGTVIGSIQNGDSAGYGMLDFGDGAGQITVRYATPRSGEVKIISRSPSGEELLETIPLNNTGSFNIFREQTFDISTISGKHDVYFEFVGGVGALFDLDNFEFIPESSPLVQDGIGAIEAEQFSRVSSDVGVFGGGNVLGNLRDGAFATYSHLNFCVAGVNQLTLFYGSPRSSRIEILDGDESGTVIATLDLPSTGSFGNIQAATFAIPLLTDIRTITFRFVGNNPNVPLLDLDRFQFTFAN
ncbi:MAG: carbohydrate-binding protein [Planctomycetota bacterium]